MDEKAKNFFAKKNIPFQDIIYFVRKNHKTELHLTNGNTIITYLPIKVLLSVIPEGIFISINKGVVVGKNHVTHIVNNVYTMIDGVNFVGRVRTPGRHLLNKYELMSSSGSLMGTGANGNSIADKFAMLDGLPIAFTLIELVFDQEGRGMDLVFKYCNAEMAKLTQVPMANLLNKSFYEVFKNADKKWLITYADVAMNGNARVVNSYSKELGCNVNIYCYQPAVNYCACAIIKA